MLGVKLLGATTPDNGMSGEEGKSVTLGKEPRGREGQEDVPVTNTGLQERGGGCLLTLRLFIIYVSF
jgi:hypothetical protein